MTHRIAIRWIATVLLFGILRVSEALDVNAVVVKRVKATCWGERVKIAREVQELLSKGDYEKLTKLAKDYRESKATLPDGSWKLNQFYESFSASNAKESEEL